MASRPWSLYGTPSTQQHQQQQQHYHAHPAPPGALPASSSHSPSVAIPISFEAEAVSPVSSSSPFNPFTSPPHSGHSRSRSLLPTTSTANNSTSSSFNPFASPAQARSAYRYSTQLEGGSFSPASLHLDNPHLALHNNPAPPPPPHSTTSSLLSPSHSLHRQTRSVGRAPSLHHLPHQRTRTLSTSSSHSTSADTPSLPLPLPLSLAANPSRTRDNSLSRQSNNMMAYSPSSTGSGSGDAFMASLTGGGGPSGQGSGAAGGFTSASPAHGSEGMRRGFSYDGVGVQHHHSHQQQQQQNTPTRPPPLQTQTTSSLLPGSFASPSVTSSSRALYSPMTGVQSTSTSGGSPVPPSSSSALANSPRLPPPSGSPFPAGQRAYSPSHYAAASGPSSATSIPPPPMSSAYRQQQQGGGGGASSSSSAAGAPPASSFYPKHIAQAYSTSSSAGAGQNPSSSTPGLAYSPAGGDGLSLPSSSTPSSLSTSPQPPFSSQQQLRDRERERLGGASTPAHHPHPQQYYQSRQYLSGGGGGGQGGGQGGQGGGGHQHGPSAHGQQQHQNQPQHQQPHQSTTTSSHGHSHSASFFPPSSSSSTGTGGADMRNLSLSSQPSFSSSSAHNPHSHSHGHQHHAAPAGAGAGGSGGGRSGKKGLKPVWDVREIKRGGCVGAGGSEGQEGGGGGGGGSGGSGGQGAGEGSRWRERRRADPGGGWVSPLKALTLSLPSTYNLVNPTFHYETSRNPRRVLTKPSKPAQNDGFDNEDSDYILYVNDVLGPEDKDRYLILDVLGQGTFGQVVKCQNLKTHEIVAVKVVKNKPAYFQQSMMEVTILELINNQWDKDDEHHMLRLKDTFIHHSHLCLVFELLSNNLYELIKQNSFRGLSTSLVRVFTAQLLDALSVLNEAKIIHCDLKPENILLKSLQSPTIKVIDFGSACHEKQTVYTYIQSRFYRSPEVILSLPYSSMIDMWSLGCICVELFLGLPLFPGTSEFNQITRIVEMLGMPPDHLLEKGKQTSHFFESVPDEYGRRRWKLKSLERYAREYNASEQPSKKYFSATTLPDIVKQYPIVRKGLKEAEVDKEMRNRIAFIDFVQGLLHLDPDQRWTPQQARMHPFVLGEPLTAPFVPPPRHVAAATAKSGSPTAAASSSSSSAAGQQQRPYGGLPSAPASGQPRRTYDAKQYQQHLQQQQGYALQAQQRAQQPTNPYAADVAAAQQQAAQMQAAQMQVAQMQAQAAQAQAAQAQAQAAQAAQAAAYAQARQAVQQPSLYGAAGGGFAPRSAAGSAPAVAVTNPPAAHHHYGQGRQRSGTIEGGGQAGLPPALQKLGHDLLQHQGGGAGQSITPVLRRDDQWQAWEQQYGAGAFSGGPGGLSRRISISTRNPHLNLLQEQAESGMGMWNSPVRNKPQSHQQQQQQAAAAAAYYTSPMQPSQAQFSVVVDPSRPGGGGGDLFDPTGGLAAPPLAYAGGARYAPASYGGGGTSAPIPPPGAAAPHTSSAASTLVDSSTNPSPFDALSALSGHHPSSSQHSPLVGALGGGHDPLSHYQPLQPYASPNLGASGRSTGPGGGVGGGSGPPGAPGVYSPNMPQGGFGGQPQGQGGGQKPKGLW